ncbi:hypothetical protein SELMODRAFT_444190 [Selaginella moellendorffii]|uniref:ER membrane protein complex subunit 10 n=1 Tax=Selaginella moellendorffii TaxID=88036 RepID=D8S7Q7_SELML|nr:ER membrane protein complex subunit 10 [Selaginella moellendorffii]EFJ19653.1 hypothetical protein SELMODRAFT_444190 [Selaginella moellendorffii]|eukprot:XP_002979245.1 ER membrane protein complex subunit 10 [Selaginella moellendorffii]
MRRLVPAIAFFATLLAIATASSGFQWDELDDEEWGFMGSSPASSPPPGPQSDLARKKQAAPEASSSPESNKLQFPLEHAFGGSEFTRAGVFTARLRPSLRGGQALGKLRLSRLPLSGAEKQAFEELLKEDGFYTIRVPANPLSPGAPFVISSIKARCLAIANLKERLDIHMDQGNIIAVGYSAGADCPYPRELKHPASWTFDTHIVSKGGEQAKTVLFNDFGLGSTADDTLGDEAMAAIKKPPPEKSFWAKYWMYIIPLGLIVMNAITQVANMQEEPGAPAGGGQQARAPAAVRRR